MTSVTSLVGYAVRRAGGFLLLEVRWLQVFCGFARCRRGFSSVDGLSDVSLGWRMGGKSQQSMGECERAMRECWSLEMAQDWNLEVS